MRRLQIIPNLVIILLPVLISSCSSFLVSPLNTTSNPYIPTPVKHKDEANKIITYGGLHLNPGVSEQESGYEDHFNYGALRFTQGVAVGRLRIGYGANLMLGSVYADNDEEVTQDPEQQYRKFNGGNLFSGAVSSNLTLSFAIPLRKRSGECRLGLQGSAGNEFGKYLSFRQKYPITNSGTIVETNEQVFTAGIFSEWVKLKKNDKRIGFKIAASLGTFQQMFYAYDAEYKAETDLPTIPHYISFNWFIGKSKVDFFLQGNIGTGVANGQVGVLVKLH